MGIFELGLLKSKEKNRELYQQHYLNAINGLLASGRSDYDELIRDADMIAKKAVEHIKKSTKPTLLRSISDSLKF